MTMPQISADLGWTMLILGLHLVAGVALGILYFHTMWRSVRSLGGRFPLKAVILGTVVRFAVLGGVLALAARSGAEPLLATAFGVMVGRFLVLRRVRGQPI